MGLGLFKVLNFIKFLELLDFFSSDNLDNWPISFLELCFSEFKYFLYLSEKNPKVFNLFFLLLYFVSLKVTFLFFLLLFIDLGEKFSILLLIFKLRQLFSFFLRFLLFLVLIVLFVLSEDLVIIFVIDGFLLI